MQIHQIQPKHYGKAGKRVGRGGKKGTYSGRGGKGQTARSGRKMVPVIRELIKRYPKLKGYRALSLHSDVVQVVNLDKLSQKFKDGDVVSPKTLVEKGIINPGNAKVLVKILGNGTIAIKVNVEGCLISKSAKAAIEKAGGSVKISNF